MSTKKNAESIRIDHPKPLGRRPQGKGIKAGRGLNVLHLEIETLLEDSKEFTVCSVARWQGRDRAGTLGRLKAICKQRGYKMHKIRKIREFVKGPLSQTYKLIKIDGEQ